MLMPATQIVWGGYIHGILKSLPYNPDAATACITYVREAEERNAFAFVSIRHECVSAIGAACTYIAWRTVRIQINIVARAQTPLLICAVTALY